MSIALEYLRSERPRLLHVGLGDADEWAHRGDYSAYLNAIHEADAFIGDMVSVLDDEGMLESTTVLVTTDHGRARDFRSHGPAFPESRRAFLFFNGSWRQRCSSSTSASRAWAARGPTSPAMASTQCCIDFGRAS